MTVRRIWKLWGTLAFVVCLGATLLAGSGVAQAGTYPPLRTVSAANPSAPALILDPTFSRPDPYAFWDTQSKRYMMVTSATVYGNVPEWTAPSMTGPWTWVGDALPHIPTWDNWPSRTWKPTIALINGTWTLWGSAEVSGSRSLCLYRATATSSAGPFTVDPSVGTGLGGDGSFSCPTGDGGDIDPQPVRDRSGAWWLTWKFNGNVTGQPTVLQSVPLGANGLPVGPVHDLLTSDQAWETGLIESPSFVLDKADGVWWLTFSAGDFGAGQSYQTAAVPCVGLGGPCFDAYTVHLLSANAQGPEPGEQSVAVGNDGSDWLLYNPAGPFYNPLLRPLALTRLGFSAGGIPYAGDPSSSFVPPIPSPVAAMASTPDGKGYWLADSTGYVSAHGDAQLYGDLTYGEPGSPIVNILSTGDGKGYWMVGADGGVFAFGDAAFYGSMGGTHLNEPVVGMAATPDGKGYWEVASDGGVFAFGDAAFYGSMGGTRLNQPVVGVAGTPDGKGYWEVASDGGVFAFGDALFYGSTGALRLNAPVVGMSASTDGKGYRFVASDGGIFSFGDAAFHGSTGGQPLNAPVVGMASDAASGGYWMVGADGGVFNFGAPFFGSA